MASAVDFETSLLDTLTGHAGLTALVDSRVFGLVIPQGTVLPCVTFQRLGGHPANTLSGHSGMEEIAVQIDAWAKTYAQAKAVAKAVRAAMPATGPVWGARLDEDGDFYEDGVNYFRISMEFTVWYSEN